MSHSKGAEEADTRQGGISNRKVTQPSGSNQSFIECPECESQRVWKDGLRYTNRGGVQRFLCRSCGFRFSEPTAGPEVKIYITGQVIEQSYPGQDFSETNVPQIDVSSQPSKNDLPLQGRKNVGSQDTSTVTVVEKGLNNFRDYNRERRVRVSEGEMKNLAEEESRTKKRAAGATKPSEANVKGKVVEFAWWLKKQGYKTSTIKVRVKAVKWLIALGADILNPESVKDTIARKEGWSDATKGVVCVAYASFLEMHELTWKKPRYKNRGSLPFIPLESEIDALINACGKVTGTFLQGLKETGADPGELSGLRWIDVNFEAKSVTVNRPVKGHDPRVLPVSDQFLRRLSSLPRKSEKVFPSTDPYATFYKQRKRIARKLNNPRIEKISFRTLRHWKGTMEYHKTHDPKHVQKLLGHKRLTSTEIYINLEQAVFVETNDEFHVNVAHNLQEARELIKVGFEYVTEMEGKKLFRKRK